MLHVALDDLDDSLPIQTVSTGNPFCIVLLGSLDAARRITIPRNAEVQKYLQRYGAKFFYFITPAADESGADWHARMMFYGMEDPATGSAAGPAIAWLVRHGRAVSEQTVVLEQGIEMSRPSRLYLSAKLVGDKVSEVFVAGRTIPVATGRFFLP
jgi:trans-2,3-dihydro-3-hydroxyanthranilate isomerase